MAQKLKRSTMTQVGAESPICECCGQPMTKAGFQSGRQQWRCRTERRKGSKADYWENAQRYREISLRRHHELKKADPNYERNRNLRQNYGLTLREYDQMVMTQCGVCAICGNPETTKKGHLAVDHNHETGEIRGLLCTRCNSGIGLLQDSPELVAIALAYLGGAPFHKN